MMHFLGALAVLILFEISRTLGADVLALISTHTFGAPLGLSKRIGRRSCDSPPTHRLKRMATLSRNEVCIR